MKSLKIGGKDLKIPTKVTLHFMRTHLTTQNTLTFSFILFAVCTLFDLSAMFVCVCVFRGVRIVDVVFSLFLRVLLFNSSIKMTTMRPIVKHLH